MIKVVDYAKKINKSADEILKACADLEMEYITNQNSILNGDDITDLENYFMEKESKRKNIKKSKEKKETLQKNVALNEEKIVVYRDNITVREFADNLAVPANEVIKKLFTLGIMANVNNNLDYETAEIIASEYEKELKKESSLDIANFEEFEVRDEEKDLKPRPPVVTIMGHVDHGKTTLLDTIRKANIASGEAGGITQAISAYQVNYKKGKITFIDTPGHAAFTQMRARGAQVTDIVIILVAADDGIMPQTKEAIDHAKEANVPIMVAINKIDKSGANPERVMTELSEYGLMPDVWGGDVLYTNISALKGDGIEELLENILLIAEMNNYRANPNRYASGVVIEASLDKTIGPIATLLIQSGTLRLGDPIVVGTCFGRIRNMKNDENKAIEEASPSQPVVVMGLSETPVAGDRFLAFENEKEAKRVWQERKVKCRQDDCLPKTGVTLDEVFSKIKEGETEVKVIVKADVQGSAEAVKNCLEEVMVEDIKIRVIRNSVGAVSENDIMLAKASGAIIISFNLPINNDMYKCAKEHQVDIRNHNIIYKVVEEMEAALKGMLAPEYEEKKLGKAEVRQLFKFSKVGVIAGSYITEGIVKNNALCRIWRDQEMIHEGKIKSIQREKDSAKEVKKGLECGITIDNFTELAEGDIIEAFEMVEIKR